MKSEAAALLSGCMYALFFLVYIEPSVFTFGGEFISRKRRTSSSRSFLYPSLAFAFAFVESRAPRYLVAFAFTCWSVMTTHPVGLAIIGLCVAGFDLVHVALNWRRRGGLDDDGRPGGRSLERRTRPRPLRPRHGNSLTAVLSDMDINSHEPEVLANMVFVKPWWKHILELEGGYYIMHLSLILNPAILAAFVLGLPFLLWRLKRSLAAQLLFGRSPLATIVCYVPPIATFVGDKIVLPASCGAWRGPSLWPPR